MPPRKQAIVLGAYGLIGAACVAALEERGFAVTGIGRSRRTAMRCNPRIQWIYRDIARTQTGDWRGIFAGADLVVNASGALQDGARDSLTGIHIDALSAMIPAAEAAGVRFVQISAAGVSQTAATPFFRTKWEGDRRLMQSAMEWYILRPVLVIGPQAYGGTALLRASAAMPLAGVLIEADARVQTVALDDVAGAVADIAEGRIHPQTVAELTEGPSQSLTDLTAALRTWLGFPPWQRTVRVPGLMARAAGFVADGLGWLGWRSPMRTNALKSLADGIEGDPAAWLTAGGRACRPLAQTLQELPSTAQERWFARVFLLLPVAIACLAAFWIVSGVMGFVSFDQARSLLAESGLPNGLIAAAVVGGSLADIALGLAVLVRRLSRLACLGMIALSLLYLMGSLLWVPALWADPLGPMVKVFPGIVLAGIVAALVGDR